MLCYVSMCTLTAERELWAGAERVNDVDDESVSGRLQRQRTSADQQSHDVKQQRQMRRHCNIHATRMQHNCNIHATRMQHVCNTTATYTQHVCNTTATYMQHVCNTTAAYTANVLQLSTIFTMLHAVSGNRSQNHLPSYLGNCLELQVQNFTHHRYMLAQCEYDPAFQRIRGVA